MTRSQAGVVPNDDAVPGVLRHAPVSPCTRVGVHAPHVLHTCRGSRPAGPAHVSGFTPLAWPRFRDGSSPLSAGSRPLSRTAASVLQLRVTSDTCSGWCPGHMAQSDNVQRERCVEVSSFSYVKISLWT